MHLFMIRWSSGRTRRERWYATAFLRVFALMLSFHLKQRRQPKDVTAAKHGADLRQWAKSVLRPIERKLKGLYSPANLKERTYGGITTRGGGQDEREISTNNLVQMLIQEAVDGANLVSCRTLSAY